MMSDVNHAICRIFVKDDLRSSDPEGNLGLGCVVKSELIIQGLGQEKRCDRVLLVSTQVLTKYHLDVARKKSNYHILAEFPGEAGKNDTFVVDINDMFGSFLDHVWETRGILFVAITTKLAKWLVFGKNKLASIRPLELFDYVDQNSESELKSGFVKCLLLEKSSRTSTSQFVFQVYDFVPDLGNNGLPADKYVLKQGDCSAVSSKADLPSNQFGEGAILLSREREFLGFVFFRDGIFPLVLRGATSEEGAAASLSYATSGEKYAEEGYDPMSNMASGGKEEDEEANRNIVSEGSIGQATTIRSFKTSENGACGGNKHPSTLQTIRPRHEDNDLEVEKLLESSGPVAVNLPLVTPAGAASIDSDLPRVDPDAFGLSQLKCEVELTTGEQTEDQAGAVSLVETKAQSETADQTMDCGDGPEPGSQSQSADVLSLPEVSSDVQTLESADGQESKPVSYLDSPQGARPKTVGKIASFRASNQPEGASRHLSESLGKPFSDLVTSTNVQVGDSGPPSGVLEPSGRGVGVPCQENYVLVSSNPGSSNGEHDHNANERVTDKNGTASLPSPRFSTGVEQAPKLRTQHSVPPACPSIPVYEASMKQKSQSMPFLTIVETKKFTLDTYIADSVLECTKLLNGLSRSLDVEYFHGTTQCWKELAEAFGIHASHYEKFVYSPVLSPTQQLFDVLESRRPNMAIGELKHYFQSIDRNDVNTILQGHIESGVITDISRVSCLSDTNPDIIGEISPLLDIKRRGVKSWEDLADKVGLVRNQYKDFGSPDLGNPTMDLVEYLCSSHTHLTLKTFKEHILTLGRRDVVEALELSKKVTDGSRLKDLKEDLDVMEKVCNLLNKPAKPLKKNWYNVGDSLNVPHQILDDFRLVDPEKARGPTEALFQFLKTSEPCLTLANLLFHLHTMKRLDAVEILMNHIDSKGYTVSELVDRCSHPSCQQNNYGQ